MNAFLVMALLCASPEVAVRIAPDHPVPIVYPDDPVIVEFEASHDLTVNVEVELHGRTAQPFLKDLGAIALWADSPYWCVIEGAPTEHDFWRAIFSFDIDGESRRVERDFCRVERPRLPDTFPVGANITSLKPRSLLALEGIPLRYVRLDGAMPDIEAHVRESFGLGMEVGVALGVDGIEGAEELAERLSNKLPDTVAAWHLRFGRDFERLESVVQALRRGGSHAPIVLVASGAQAVVALLDAGGGGIASAIELEGDNPGELELSLIREAAEHAGYEALPIYTVGRGVPRGADQQGIRLSRQILLNRAAGIARSHFDMDLIYEPEQIGEGYVYLSAAAQFLDGATYLAELEAPAPMHAPLFRHGNRWVMAFWTAGEPADLPLHIGEASALSLTDARGNALPVPALEEGGLVVSVGAEPRYLAGRGGDIMLEAALRRAQAEAEALAENKDFEEHLSEEILDVFKAVAEETQPPEEEVPDGERNKPGRPSFFALLRAFPYLEQQWLSGDLPREIAVPAMAALTRLVRLLCLVEQDSGDEFIEPLSNTLAECREYQMQYLMDSSGETGGQARGEWLLEEISGLAAEAEQLQAQGRQIEARGLAILAEWRARSLAFAAQAEPLERPMRLKGPEDQEPEQEPGKLQLKKRVEE